MSDFKDYYFISQLTEQIDKSIDISNSQLNEGFGVTKKFIKVFWTKMIQSVAVFWGPEVLENINKELMKCGKEDILKWKNYKTIFNRFKGAINQSKSSIEKNLKNRKIKINESVDLSDLDFTNDLRELFILTNNQNGLSLLEDTEETDNKGNKKKITFFDRFKGLMLSFARVPTILIGGFFCHMHCKACIALVLGGAALLAGCGFAIAAGTVAAESLPAYLLMYGAGMATGGAVVKPVAKYCAAICKKVDDIIKETKKKYPVFG